MSFPRYERYKDSGVEWLGEVPAHWEVAPFKWQVERNDGGVWGDDPDGQDDTVVLRSTEQTVDGRWRMDDPASRKLSSGDRQASLLAKGDLVVTKSSGSSLHIGKTTLVTAEIAAVGCCYSNFMQRIRLKPSFMPKLAWYVMNNNLARLQFDLLSNSTTGLANLNGTMIGRMVLPVPPTSEQATIATFLDQETAKIDALVEEQKRLIELLKEKRQAVISHAVTKGLNPNAPMKDSGVEWLGEVPAHWDVQPLKYVAAFRSGGTPDKSRLDYWDGDVPWASAKDLKVDELFDTGDHITGKALEAGAASLVPAKSVLVVVRGMILARTFPVVTVGVPMAINQDLKAVTARSNATAEFLPWLLRGAAAESLSRLDEAGHGTKALRMEAWGDMRVAVPPLMEQAHIAEHLRIACAALDIGLDFVGRGIDLLQERRTALISAAVTGKIDVRISAQRLG